MNKPKRFLLILVVIFFLLIPLIAYYLNFKSLPLSKSTETWGQFGDYLNGTFMPLIALVGIIVTILISWISDTRNKTNIRISQQKRRPILHIGYHDFEDKLEIFLKNKGNGPLIIKDYILLNIVTKQEFSDIFQILPYLGDGKVYNNYTGSLNNYVFAKDEEMNLFSFVLGEEEDEHAFLMDSEKIRRVLKNYKIIVSYKDVYDEDMPTYERSLEWFGRNIKD